MKKKVLSREQMAKLIELKFDVSNASAMWTPHYKGGNGLVDYNEIESWSIAMRNDETTIEEYKLKFPLSFKDCVYAYTLEDLIDLIVGRYSVNVEILTSKSVNFKLLTYNGEVYAEKTFEDENLIDAAFEGLMLLIELLDND